MYAKLYCTAGQSGHWTVGWSVEKLRVSRYKSMPNYTAGQDALIDD